VGGIGEAVIVGEGVESAAQPDEKNKKRRGNKYQPY
jgi:hypothetical protein